MLVSELPCNAYRLSRTAGFALVEPDEEANDSNHDEEKPNKIKFCQMLLEWSSFMGIEVQEEEKDCCSNTTGWPMDDIKRDEDAVYEPGTSQTGGTAKQTKWRVDNRECGYG